jgi:hypothetical protein
MRQNGTNEYDPLSHQMVSLDSTYLLFGYGRHAWCVLALFRISVIEAYSRTIILSSPGRFFAVNEIKAMVAHILLNYDIKLPGDAKVVPPGRWFAGNRIPDPKAEMMFRKRKVA